MIRIPAKGTAAADPLVIPEVQAAMASTMGAMATKLSDGSTSVLSSSPSSSLSLLLAAASPPQH